MREGYIIQNFINFEMDRFIEVVNIKSENEVMNFGWQKIESIKIFKDEDSIGVWKIKSK